MSKDRYLILKDISLSLISTLGFLFSKGFIFNTADQIEPLVLVYKKLNPTFFSQDFYVNAAKDIFTVRYYYVELLSFLGKYFSIHHISLFITFCCLFFSSWGLIKITRTISGNKITGYLSPFFVLFIFLSWTVGGNELQYNLLIGSSIAKSLSIWSLYFLLKARNKTSAFLLGVSGLFQVLVSLQLAMLILAILLIQKKWKLFVEWGSMWLIFISPVLIPVFYRQFLMTNEGFDTELFYTLLYSFRNPQHYLPHLFSTHSYIKLGFLVLIGNLFLSFTAQRRYFKPILWLNGLIILGLVFYSVLIEFFGIEQIGKLQWFKTTIWLNAIAAIGFSIVVENILLKLRLQKITFVLAVLLIGFIYLYRTPKDKMSSLDRRSDAQIELQKVHQWIYENTDIHSVFATYIDDEYFYGEAQRALIISWNAIIHEPWFMIEWYEKLYQQYGVEYLETDYLKTKILANQNYEKGDWLKSTKADYCIVKSTVEFPQTKTVYNTENYKVLKLNE